MKKKKIAIIGAGKLGCSITEGLLKAEYIEAKNLIITRRKIEHLKKYSELGVQTIDSNSLAIEQSDIIIIAVKPHQIEKLLKTVSGFINSKKILISVVTGVSIEEIRKFIGKNNIDIFRAMPNTAIAMQESMTCIATDIDSKNIDIVTDIFKNLGKTVVIEENLMGAATILAASGIAFILRYIRAATQGGIEIGFSSELAKLITTQTVKGAVALLEKRKEHPEKEIDMVTTPRGVTISGLNEMEHQGFSSSLIKGLITSYEKIDKIAK